jgi:hypothetical protein
VVAPDRSLILPPLPYEAWADTKQSIHRFAQIVGKVRLGAQPFRNHWWHATLRPTVRGLTTGPIPRDEGAFSLELDFLDHTLRLATSEGDTAEVSLLGQSIASFYDQTMAGLRGMGIDASIYPVPFDLKPPTPFPADADECAYDPDAARRWWRIVLWSEGVFQRFAGRFQGKTSPVQVFWHSFDLAYTRFSGKAAPPMPEADPVTREAYAQEVVSFGWWPGDARVPYPAFYSYTAPEPAGLTDRPLNPAAALWFDTGRGSQALLPYEAVREAADPTGDVLAFLQSAYDAGADLAGWDRAALDREPRPV